MILPVVLGVVGVIVVIVWESDKESTTTIKY